MKIKVLGSAAAEALPAPWCECEVCKYAREHKGKDVRRRTCYCIDDDTLVDFGPDIFYQSIDFNINLVDIKRVFITHSHADHLNPLEFEWRRAGFSVVTQYIDLYANQHSLDRVHKELPGKYESYKINDHLLQSGTTIEADDITLTSLRASHVGPDEDALNFIIERNGKKLLVANDTGWWGDETWEAVKGIELDGAIIESCSPLKPMDYWAHLNGDQTVAFRDKLRELGAVTDKTKVYTNHFSHNGGEVIHDKIVDFFEPQGIVVCYDGMEIVL